MNGWTYLILAILFEIIGTTALKASAGFTRLGPSLAVALGYGAAFYCLSLALKSVPLGVAYAVWSGLGTALIALLGVLLFREGLHPVQALGILLVIAGVVLLNRYGPAH